MEEKTLVERPTSKLPPSETMPSRLRRLNRRVDYSTELAKPNGELAKPNGELAKPNG